MSLRKAWLLFPLASMLVLTSCEENTKKAKSTPPPQASAPTLTASAPAAQPTAPTPAANTDPVPQTVAEVEKAYNAGKANYDAGHMEAAKADFDHAVDKLLQSRVQVKSDERLEREFERVVDEGHQIEMVALKEGDGFSKQKSQPTQIDEGNQGAFPVDPNVKAKADAEVKLTRSD